MTPFIIFALPRSRTKWLSCFLTYGEWNCGHDELLHCRSLDDVRSWFSQPATGTVETAGAPFWRLLPRDVRVITVRRPIEAVMASLSKLLSFDPPVMRALIGRLDRKLDQLEARVPGVRRFEFDELVQEETCAELFSHCLGYPHDHSWWQAHASLNIQVNIHHELRYYTAHKQQLEKLAAVAKHRTLAGLWRAPQLDGVTFQHEPFRRFYEDAKPLFAEHLVQTEQSPSDHMRKNLPMFQLLDDLGCLQTITARSNGRMFGYLVTIVGPSLDYPDRPEALHTIFFASPLIRNLGMNLQRASIGFLRERGVRDLVMRAGHRGAGPRLGIFYKRLGAEPFGQLWRLALTEN